jgi:nicotinate-nucleotide adenylyltransferase
MIWIYGGAFNPPTLAHQNIISHIQLMFPDDRLIVVPVGNDYQKPSLIDFFHRYHMCHLAFENVEISMLEHDQIYKGTLNLLQTIYNQTQEEVGFIMGADQLLNLKSWIQYQSLIENHACIIITREGFKLETYQSLLTMFKKYIIIDMSYPISSSQIRLDVTSSLSHINPKVFAYIQMHGLYKE